jgi:CheY-like chemotaxis protein
MAQLVVISKGLPASTCEVGEHWVTIGRASTNVFQILEASVSGHHCEVLWQGGQLAVRDMRSTNGTFINGAMVSEGVVRPGETFRLGEVELRLEAPPAPPVIPKISITLNGKTGPNHPPAAPAPQASPAAQEKRHQVLLVDDSMAFLETLGEMLEALSDKTWEIHRAATSDQALVILQQHQIQLAVLDINMPMLDGVQLLSLMQRRHPEVKKVVVTAHATEAYRATCLANGAELFLEKPLSSDGFVSIFNLLNDLLAWSQRGGFSGALQQVGLTDVIQIECLRRSSSILEIINPEIRGEIFIATGAIVHAVAGALTGEKALYRLLAISNGQFRVQPFRPPTQQTIEGAWEYLLMEAARVRDEEKSLCESSETIVITQRPEAPLASAPISIEGLDAGIRDLGEDVVVVSTYDGEWRPVDGGKK